MERVKSIDTAKTIGIFLIVLGHVLRSGYLEYFIFSFHVPLFFILSGVCWNEPGNFGLFIRKKFKGLIVPYVNFGLLSVIIYSLLSNFVIDKLQGGGSISFLNCISGLVYGNSKIGNMEWNTPLWFLPCLFTCNIIVYLIEKVTKRRISFEFLAVIFLFILHNLFIIFFPRLYLPFQTETAVGMSGYFVIGILIKKFYSKLEIIIQKSKAFSLAILISILCLIDIACIIYNNNVRIDVRIDHYGNYFLFVIGAVSLSLSIIIISCRLHSKIMQYIGKHTLCILLMHKFPIVFAQAIIPGGSIVLTNPNSIIGIMLALFIAFSVILLCLLADYIIRRFLPFLYFGFNIFIPRK